MEEGAAIDADYGFLYQLNITDCGIFRGAY
jgi:hypothetical protein